jgi:hypothetical protein
MDLFIDVSSLERFDEMLYLTFLPDFNVLQIPLGGTRVKGVWASRCENRTATP